MTPNGLSVTDSDMEAKLLINNLNNIKSPQIDEKIKKPFRREIVWKNLAVYIIGHAITLYGLYLSITFQISIPLIIYTIFLAVLVIEGIIMGAHRFYSHRTFKASKPLQIAMLILQTAASQKYLQCHYSCGRTGISLSAGVSSMPQLLREYWHSWQGHKRKNCCWVWARDHRQHHKYSDTDADPHNAKNGFFFSHVGWLLSRKHPDVIEKGKGIDMSDLNADPYLMFQKRHYKKLWVAFALILPLLFPVYVLGEDWLSSFIMCDVVRIVVSLNATWMVNSWAHLYGNRPFDKSIMPVESYVVGFFGLGEGWHNYHHTFPMDYKASELGSPLNLTAKVIRTCERFGWAWDLKEATPDMIVARAARTGDGTAFWTTLDDRSNSSKSL